MKNFVLVLFLLITSINYAQSKAYTNIKEIRENSKKVANRFVKNDIDKLFDDLKPYWALSDNQIDTLKVNTKRYIPRINQSFGNAIDAIKIKEINLENAVFKETYLIRYLKSALRLKIIYYNNSKGWFINSFEWDDKFTEELD